MRRIKFSIAVVLLMISRPLIAAMPQLDSLFVNPPQEARALMIWQWMDGLITREGITADLEAYREAGLGGVQQFQIGGPLQGMIRDTTNAVGTQNWCELMGFALQECRRLGLSFGTHNCPGWSSSAYPEVEPAYSMQKLVWNSKQFVRPTDDKDSKKTMKGKKGQKVQSGPFVAIPEPPEVDKRWNYYEDIALLVLPADSVVALKDIKVLPPNTDAATLSNLQLQGDKQWMIVRIGHTTNGKMNDAQAPYGGVGLECDKMSREALDRYWNTYPKMLFDIGRSALGTDMGSTFQRIEIDSYEAGGQEWTRLFPEEFSKRRGYDIKPWLAALTGKVIDSQERTAQFKRDYATTGAELFAENYYGYMSTLVHQIPGMRLLYQPYGTGSSKPFNPLDIWKITSQLKGDILCTEFWNKPSNWGWPSVPRHVDVAHRQRLHEVYAEAFTCWPLHAWKDDPADIKIIADRAFAMGVNRLMLHAGAHNPWTKAIPGMTFGKWGTQFTPGQTWWRSGGARLLFNYFARCQALLQQGDFVDDYRSRSASVVAEGLQWTHRRTVDADIYFFSNPKDAACSLTVSIAAAERIPELWHPDTGLMTEAEAWRQADGKTQVALEMEPHGSLFIVMRRPSQSAGPGLQLTQPAIVSRTAVEGSWTLTFPEGWGAPAQVVLDKLIPWNEHTEAGVKYFSGTARYTIDFQQKRKDKQARYLLDLGSVKNLARVFVNDIEVAHLWKQPFRCDITEELRKGRNTLVIEVTNLWPNRMIGDEQYPDDTEWSDLFTYDYAPGKPAVGRFMKHVPDWLKNGVQRPETKRCTVVSFKYFEKNAPLLQSGLLGPVEIVAMR